MNESEYGRQIAVLVQKFEEDLFTHPLPAEGFVRGLRASVAQTNNINRANDDNFGMHNSTDMNSTVKPYCQSAADKRKVIYSHNGDDATAIQATVPLPTYEARHEAAVDLAIQEYHKIAKPFARWKAFQTVLDDLEENYFPSCWKLIVDAHFYSKSVRFDEYKTTILNSLNDVSNLAAHFPADLDRYRAAVNAVGKLDQPATAEQVENLIRSVREDSNPNGTVIQLTIENPAVTTQIQHPAKLRINNIPAVMGRRPHYSEVELPAVPAKYERRKLCRVRKCTLLCYLHLLIV